MQKPPPVPALLGALQTFAGDVEERLATAEIDWDCSPAPGDWCLTEVMCHLRDVEKEVHQPRFLALVEAEGAFIPGAVSDDWVEERRYREEHGPTALAQFLAARKETLAILLSCDDDIWSREGQHAFFGPTTMHELLFLAVQHDEAHWEQLLQLLEMQTSGAPPSHRAL